MGRKQRRLTILVLSGLCLLTAVALVMVAFDDNLTYFFGPSDVQTGKVKPGTRFRLGGLVEKGSVVKAGTTVNFIVTDEVKTVVVTYTGILPDLFREGQGIVAEGVLSPDMVFKATDVLAKHDENYMPPEVAEALKNAGVWQESSDQ
jgi:cytochrome c-type biogenesis protein CcmE